MEQRIQVIIDYVSEFHNPILMKKGSTINILKRNDGKYTEWFWCRTDEGVEAYVPENSLEITDNTGTFLHDYNSKELNVAKGEILISLYETGGWIWAKKSSGEEGWIPDENTEPYNLL